MAYIKAPIHTRRGAMTRAMTEENGHGLVAQGKAERKAQRKAERAERRMEKRRDRRLGEALPPLSTMPFASLGRAARPPDDSEPPLSLSILPIGASRPSEEDYHRGWQEISGEELSRQLSAASLFFGGLGESKNAALRKLYAGVT